MTQVSKTALTRIEQERKNYIKELNMLKVKYSLIFNNIAKEISNEQITATNR